MRVRLVHLMLGSVRTWCGKQAGFHHQLVATTDVERATCERCVRAYARRAEMSER